MTNDQIRNDECPMEARSVSRRRRQYDAAFNARSLFGLVIVFRSPCLRVSVVELTVLDPFSHYSRPG